jgi:hypothetical protein
MTADQLTGGRLLQPAKKERRSADDFPARRRTQLVPSPGRSPSLP